MIELPEAVTLAAQASELVVGRVITAAEAGHTPHRLTWFTGEPSDYRAALTGRTLTGASAVGGHVVLEAGEVRVVLSDAAVPRRHAPGERLPDRHQLRLDLDDGAALVVTVAMYGGIELLRDGDAGSPYLAAARRAPSPLTAAFDADWFAGLLAADGVGRLSAKAFLATEQRVPGLGNGVLQDVLWVAGIHPRRKVATLSDAERAALHSAVTGTLRAMADAGGRDTERDLRGRPGRYPTVMCRGTLHLPCPRCGGPRSKEAYLGGSVYVCAACQPLG